MSPFIDKDISQAEKIRVKDHGSATESQNSSPYASPGLAQNGQTGRRPDLMHHGGLSPKEEAKFDIESDIDIGKSFNSGATRLFQGFQPQWI